MKGYPLFLLVAFLATDLWAGETQDQILAAWIGKTNTHCPKVLSDLVKKGVSFGLPLRATWDAKPSKQELLRLGVPEKVGSATAPKDPPNSALTDWKAFTMGSFKLVIGYYGAEVKETGNLSRDTYLFILKDGHYQQLWAADACSAVRVTKPYQTLPPFILCYQSGCGSGLGLNAYVLKGDGTLDEVGDLGGWYPMGMSGYVTDWNINLAFVRVKDDAHPEILEWSGVMGWPEGLEEKIKTAVDYDDAGSAYHLDRYELYRWTGKKFELRGTFYQTSPQDGHIYMSDPGE